MRLKTLELAQICQHEHLRWEFGSGLIGIYGPNGSGKSNAMNVACYGGLTNDYSRHQSGKPGLIRQQAGPKDKSEIRLEFEHAGDVIELTRGLRAPADKHFLTSPGVSLSSAKKIAKHLDETLGVQRQLIDDYMFVQQQDLFAILSANGAERVKSFAYLCGTTKAELVWTLLGDQITLDTPLASQVVDNSDELRTTLGVYTTRLREVKQTVAEARKRKLKKTEEKQFVAVVQQRNNWKRHSEALPELSRREAALFAAAKAAVAQKKLLESEAVAAREAQAAATSAATSATAQLATAESVQQQWATRAAAELRYAEVQKALAVLQAPRKPSGPPEQELRDAELMLRDTITEDTRLLEGCDVAGCVACPTCSTPVDTLQGRIDAARARQPKQVKKRQELAIAIQHWATYTKALTAYERELAQKQIREAEIANQLANLSELPEVDDEKIAEWQSQVAAADEAVTAREVADAAATTQAVQTATAVANHKEKKRQVVETEKQLAASVVSDEDFAAAEHALAIHTQAVADEANAEARKQELETFVADTREQLENLRRVLARSARAREWLHALQDVRDEVMHRDKLPRHVHQCHLDAMVDGVNDTLSEFGSPFVVSSGPEVSFTAQLPNGTVMDGAGLSGGQQVLLGLAYRLTANSQFAPELGMMILDEPTDGLDTDNRRLCAEFFTRLSSLAKSRNLQVVVITHDNELRHVFDQKFELGQ